MLQWGRTSVYTEVSLNYTEVFCTKDGYWLNSFGIFSTYLLLGLTSGGWQPLEHPSNHWIFKLKIKWGKLGIVAWQDATTSAGGRGWFAGYTGQHSRQRLAGASIEFCFISDTLLSRHVWWFLLLLQTVIWYPCLRVYVPQIHVDLSSRFLDFLPESNRRPRDWQSRALTNWASFTSSRIEWYHFQLESYCHAWRLFVALFY